MHGLKDTAPGGNVIQPVTRPFNARNIVYAFDAPNAARRRREPARPRPADPEDRPLDDERARQGRPQTGRPRHALAGFGRNADQPEGGRFFAVYPDGIRFLVSPQADVKTNSPLDLGRWQMLTATYDGDSLTIYKDAAPIMKKRMGIDADAEPAVSLGAADPWDHQRVFAGGIQISPSAGAR